MIPETDTGTTEWAVTTSGLREKVGGIRKSCLLHVKSWREDGTVRTFLTKGIIQSLGRLKLKQAVRGFTWPKPVDEVTSGTVGTLLVKGRTLGDWKPELKRFDWNCCTCWNWGDDGCCCCCGTKENCCSEVTLPSGNLVIWKSYWKVGIFVKVLEVELLGELWMLLLLRLTLLSLRRKLLSRKLLMGLLTGWRMCWCHQWMVERMFQWVIFAPGDLGEGGELFIANGLTRSKLVALGVEHSVSILLEYFCIFSIKWFLIYCFYSVLRSS